jgi:hypothetical protein
VKPTASGAARPWRAEVPFSKATKLRNPVALSPSCFLDWPSEAELKPTPFPEAKAPILASVVLQRLHDEAPKVDFTLGWLLDHLHKRSFGIIMVLLPLVAVAPDVSIVAGLLLMIPAAEMIAGRHAQSSHEALPTVSCRRGASTLSCNEPYQC